MPTLLASACEADHVDDYADFDPAILASLRTPADESALLAAVETQLTARANGASAVGFPAQRSRAHPEGLRAA